MAHSGLHRLVVLSADRTKVDPMTIKDIKVIETIVEGKRVYKAADSRGAGPRDGSLDREAFGGGIGGVDVEVRGIEAQWAGLAPAAPGVVVVSGVRCHIVITLPCKVLTSGNKIVAIMKACT